LGVQVREFQTKLKRLSGQIEEVKKSLRFDSKKDELKSLEEVVASPTFWQDQEKAKELMQRIGALREEIATFEKLQSDLSSLLELAEEKEFIGELDSEIIKIEARLKEFQKKTYLSGVYDSKNAIVSIHAGQGGVEAMDWVSILFRMYLRFCEKRKWGVQILDETPGEEAGLKSVVFKISGMCAYGYLKNEAGTHRLVRQSPFNADRLRQTSFALVEVLPELEEVDLPDIKINEDDLEWQFFRASSQGGQNVQKVSTAVRLSHKPTGIVVTAQSERFQEQNRKIALNLLRAKLWARKQEETQKTKRLLKGEYRPATWGTQIRSYVLHPYKMVKDLRTGVETSNTEAVLDGELDEFIEAELRML